LFDVTFAIGAFNPRALAPLNQPEVAVMFRPESYRSFLSIRVTVFALGFLLSTGSGSALWAVGLNYVDADEFINLTPAAAITTAAAADGLWRIRQDFGLGQGGIFTVYEASAEDAQQLTQKITGLTPGKSYDVYAVFTTDDDENWTIRTGFTPGTMSLYSFWGNRGPAPVADSTPGLTAGAAVWDTLPPFNKEGTMFTERPTDTLVQLLGKAGTIAANGAGEIDVLIDDLPNIAPNTGPRRTWLEGVAYTDAGTQIALNATLDRNTGALTINNPTTTPFSINAYSLVSTVGSLNATSWTTISGWDTTAMPDITAQFATDLTQTDPALTGATIAAGGSLTFGNVWQKGPFEDVLIRLTRTDNEIAVIVPQYTGTAIPNGDFDGNGAINLADFQILLNGLHTAPGQPTRHQNYQLGELTGNNAIDFNDWTIFRAAYDAANGAGAFESLLAQVPEPGSIVLLLIACASSLLRGRRRTAACGLAATLCLLSTNESSAATLLKADVDARAGDSTAGPPGNNTVDGFMPFTMDTGTTGPQPTVTGTVGGYNIMLTAVMPDGTPLATGGLDDRDRATPTTAPMLNQLYDDFIFANVATTGEGGGLDMAISGGTLLPNTQYGVSIYSFDTGSTGLRTANWLDGNSADAVGLTTSFDGAMNSPTMDDQYKFNGVFRTDGTGKLLLRARETAAASHGVFINGFEITDELPAPPVELTLQVNTTTGAVSIVNEQTVSFDVSYYEIRSSAGALNAAGWASLDDAEGGDPVGTGWDQAPTSSANILSEVNLQSMRTLAPTNAVSLGNAFTPGGSQNLVFSYAGPTETALHTGIIKFVTGPSGVDGDYNADGNVDAADYVVWRKTDGTQTTLPNDTTPGSVTTADYAVWRSNFGKSAPAGAGLASASAVPEPHTWLLGLLAIMSAIWLRQQKTRC
jgi:hypothetical protein